MITFEYPGYNPTVSITLGSPEKGDDERSLDELYVHPTEGDTFKSNVSISCLGDFERALSFTGICQEQKEDFVDFVRDATGQYIKYTDYEGRVWMTQITDEVMNVSNSPFGWNIDMTLLVWEMT